jgi:hypothetical protein
MKVNTASDFEAECDRLAKQYSLGLEAWRQNNAYYAQENARLRKALEAARKVIDTALAKTDE